MVGPRYPLEALRQLRDERAEALTHALAAQIARSQAAEAKLLEQEAVRKEHAARTAEAEREELERLGAGVSGVDWQRLAEFSAAARLQAAGLQRLEAQARAALAEEHAKELRIRDELAAREAEAELVRRHEAGFYAHHAERQEKAEEDAALEQWGARRH